MTIKLHFYLFVFMSYLCLIRKLKLFLIFYGFAMLHELAHILVAFLVKVKLKELTLLPVGIHAKFQKIEDSSKEILIACAGPLFSIILAYYFQNTQYFEINLVIAVLNLIPIYPLDGGRILKGLLNLIIGYKHSVRICGAISIFLAIVFSFFSIIFFVYFRNLSFVLLSFYLWILVTNEIKEKKAIENMRRVMKTLLYE